MKFCQPHWDALRAAVRDRGLERFIAPSGGEATRRMIDGDSPRDSFEPLMRAHNAIVGNLIGVFGAVQVIGYDGCPLCAAIENCSCNASPCSYQTWIDRAADDAKQEAVELGLIGGT